MDNEKTMPTVSAMPKSTPFAPAIAGGEATQASAFPLMERPATGERNAVFVNLVKDDGDIAGLVAYPIYKQHKLDWLTAFETAKRRAPNDAELDSYIIGEGTPRRLVTYRHLAEAVLAGHGPGVAGQPAPGRAPFQKRPEFNNGSAMTPGLIATYALIAVLFLVGLWLAAHFQANGPVASPLSFGAAPIARGVLPMFVNPWLDTPWLIDFTSVITCRCLSG